MPNIKTPGYFLSKIQELKHRGVGTKYGKKAAKLIYREYKKLGLRPKIQRYYSVKNTWVIYWLQYIGFFASVFFISKGNYFWAVIFFLIGILMAYEIIDLVPLYIKLMPAKTQNIYVKLSPKKKPKKTIVVVGHYDTPKWTWPIKLAQPILKKSFIKNIDKEPGFFSGPLMFAPVISFLNFLLFFFHGTYLGNLLLWAFFALALGYTIIMLGVAFSPYVPGAFDNGSGASVAMSLASYFSGKKLKNTDLYILNSGSEETIYKGVAEFAKKLNLDKKSTYFINLDGVGADKPYLIRGEAFLRGGVLYYDKELYAAARSLLKLKKYSLFEESILPMATDARTLVEKKYRVVCTLCSTYNDGNVKQYHQMDDTIEKINFKTLVLCRDFAADLIMRLDK